MDLKTFFCDFAITPENRFLVTATCGDVGR